MTSPPFSLTRCVDEARIDQVNLVCARRSDAMFAAIEAREAARRAGRARPSRLASRISAWLGRAA
jgi:hypothetical protein